MQCDMQSFTKVYGQCSMLERMRCDFSGTPATANFQADTCDEDGFSVFSHPIRGTFTFQPCQLAECVDADWLIISRLL